MNRKYGKETGLSPKFPKADSAAISFLNVFLLLLLPLQLSQGEAFLAT